MQLIAPIFPQQMNHFIFAASEEEESNIKIKGILQKEHYFSNTGKYIIETIKTPTIKQKK
mgnify:CR=1 FL=1